MALLQVRNTLLPEHNSAYRAAFPMAEKVHLSAKSVFTRQDSSERASTTTKSSFTIQNGKENTEKTNLTAQRSLQIQNEVEEIVSTETAEDLLLKECPEEETQKEKIDEHTCETLDSEEGAKDLYDFPTQTNKTENEFKALTLRQISSDPKVENSKSTTTTVPIKEKSTPLFPEIKKNDFIKEERVLNKAEFITLSPKEHKSAHTQLRTASVSEAVTFVPFPSKTESTLQQSVKEKVREEEKKDSKQSVLSTTIQKEESVHIKSDREKEREGKERGQQEQKEQSDENKDKKRKNASLSVSTNRKASIESIEDTNQTKVEKEAELSALMQKITNQMEVIYLYVVLLKLMIESKKQEKSSRHEERILQLDHMQEVIKSYKSTSSAQFSSGLLGGILGIASGVVPIFGFTKIGELVLDKFGEAFSTLKGLLPEDAFSKLGKVLASMSQMTREMGEVRKTNDESHRYKDQQYGEMRRSDGEENTRGLDDIKQEFRALMQTILEMLRQAQELANSLYAR